MSHCAYELKGDSQMSKKEKAPSTPESRAEKLANKQMLRKVFSDTFLKAFSVCLAILLLCSVVYIAFINPSQRTLVNSQEPGGASAVQSNVVQNNSTGDSQSGTPSGDQSSAGDSGAGEAALPSVSELTASSSQAEILSYFNTAINKVKPNAKSITITHNENYQAGKVEGSIPSGVASMADSLISSNMGEKDVSQTPPATDLKSKNAMFPVENEDWASKLTEADIDSATVQVTDSQYIITVKVKEDASSADTAHGVGHHGKAFSVVMPSIVTDNAGPAKNLIKDVQTGSKNGTIVITVDKATGNVVSADYDFVWTLSLKALGMQISIPFGIKSSYTIAW